MASARPSISHPSHTSSSNTASLRPSLHSAPTSALQSRINAKWLELQNLQALRDLSAQLTTQLETLQAKLGSLRDGAGSVALVMANWETVLSVIRMAATRVPVPDLKGEDGRGDGARGDGDGEKGETEAEKKQELPVPLVRIPVKPSRRDGG